MERRGGCVGSFFVGICDDIDPADRLGEAFATSTGGQWFRIVQHITESYCEGERVRRKGRLVVEVARWVNRASLSEARKLIDDRQDDVPLANKSGSVRVGWMHDGGRGRAKDVEGQVSPSSREELDSSDRATTWNLDATQAPHRTDHTWLASGRCRTI